MVERLPCKQDVGSSSLSIRTILLCRKYKVKVVNKIKQISKREIEKLLSDSVIKNTRRGYVDRYGEHIGYYKTCGGKRYIEDKYAK